MIPVHVAAHTSGRSSPLRLRGDCPNRLRLQHCPKAPRARLATATRTAISVQVAPVPGCTPTESSSPFSATPLPQHSVVDSSKQKVETRSCSCVSTKKNHSVVATKLNQAARLSSPVGSAVRRKNEPPRTLLPTRATSPKQQSAARVAPHASAGSHRAAAAAPTDHTAARRARRSTRRSRAPERRAWPSASVVMGLQIYTVLYSEMATGCCCAPMASAMW